MKKQILTAENIETVKENMVYEDQKNELIPGCITWNITYDNGQSGRITIWPDGRAAIATGANSVFGDWNSEKQIILLDETNENGNRIKIDTKGNEIEEY